MRGRRLFLVIASGIFAAACIRLGFWQISRLREKQRYNETVASRRFLRPINVDSLPGDSSQAKFRRVQLRGRFDFGHEIVWTLRTRDGSPGVNILTPLIRTGHDTAVLVNRGWIYSPDAMHVDLNRWREKSGIDGEGYVLPLSRGAAKNSSSGNRSFRALDYGALARVFPYPVAKMYAVLTRPSGGDSIHAPPRVLVLPLDEGSHRSYALQWFSFAAISIFGALIFVRRT